MAHKCLVVGAVMATIRQTLCFRWSEYLIGPNDVVETELNEISVGQSVPNIKQIK